MGFLASIFGGEDKDERPAPVEKPAEVAKVAEEVAPEPLSARAAQRKVVRDSRAGNAINPDGSTRSGVAIVGG